MEVVYNLPILQAWRDQDYVVGLGWPYRDAVVTVDDAAGQAQAQGAQPPVVDIHRQWLIVIQIGQGDAVGLDQGFVAVEAEPLGRRPDRRPS